MSTSVNPPEPDATAAPETPTPPANPVTVKTVPLQVTVQPTHQNHWAMILMIISAVLKAEQPILLQVLPTPGKAGVVGAEVGLDAVLAALAAGQQ